MQHYSTQSILHVNRCWQSLTSNSLEAGRKSEKENSVLVLRSNSTTLRWFLWKANFPSHLMLHMSLFLCPKAWILQALPCLTPGFPGTIFGGIHVEFTLRQSRRFGIMAFLFCSWLYSQFLWPSYHPYERRDIGRRHRNSNLIWYPIRVCIVQAYTS